MHDRGSDHMIDNVGQNNSNAALSLVRFSDFRLHRRDDRTRI